MKPLHIIGVPLDLGGNRRGTDMGPSAFRIAGIERQLASLGLTVVDWGESYPKPSSAVERDLSRPLSEA